MLELTNQAGVDVAIEAVGLHATFDICTLTTRLVDTITTPILLKIVEAGCHDAKKLASHRFTLAEIMRANHIFGNAAEEHALKVILTNN